MSDSEANVTLLAHTCSRHHPKTVERIVRRSQALVSELLPVLVSPEEITAPTSSILTEAVVDAFSKIGGSFSHIVPFALLEARRRFRHEARIDPANCDENLVRKLACEALARKLVARTELREQYAVMSARFTLVDDDGDETLPCSALESAADQQATFFLSSSEAQRVVFALWKGLLIQASTEDGSIEYRMSGEKGDQGVYARFDPSRIAVPRYQFIFRTGLWILFLAAYSIALQTPDAGQATFGIEDTVLFVQIAGYLLEELVMIYKIRSWQAFGFWNIVNWLIFGIAGISLGYRVADFRTHSDKLSAHYRLLSFQWLACAAPLIWMRVLQIFDVYQFFGTCQILLRRMMRESAIFFLLLTLLGGGVFQALSGIDAADGNQDSTNIVFHSLLQALLGGAQFANFEKGPIFGTVIYYGWTAAVSILLLNILIALFGSAYAESAEDSVPTFMAFFAAKTISAIRAPDTYVYVAPLNLIEIFFVAPLEYVLSPSQFAALNRYLMSVIFFFPLLAIAVFETHFDPSRRSDYLALTQAPVEYTPEDEDPEAWYDTDEYGPGENREAKIATVPFAQLKENLPLVARSQQAEILYQIKQLREELAAMKKSQT